MTDSKARRNLFLDDVDIESIENLSRNVNQPDWDPETPVLRPEHPWEMGGISHYGTVLYDEAQQQFRFYYFTHAGEGGYQAKMVTMGGESQARAAPRPPLLVLVLIAPQPGSRPPRRGDDAIPVDTPPRARLPDGSIAHPRLTRGDTGRES